VTPVTEKIPPIEISLGQAFTVQDSLFVKAEIDIKKDILADEVLVSAIGLNEGSIKVKQSRLLSDVVESVVLESGTKLVVPFELPIKELSEFQLKCSWGEDSKHVSQAMPTEISELPPTVDLEAPEPRKPDIGPDLVLTKEGEVIERKNISSGKLAIDSINLVEEVKDCENCQGGTEKWITINAVVKNLKNLPITNLSLAFGLFWTSEGKISDLPADLHKKLPSEEELSFGNLQIPVGGSIPFSVKIGRPVIVVPGGSFRPHIRILGYEIVEGR